MPYSFERRNEIRYEIFELLASSTPNLWCCPSQAFIVERLEAALAALETEDFPELPSKPRRPSP